MEGWFKRPPPPISLTLDMYRVAVLFFLEIVMADNILSDTEMFFNASEPKLKNRFVVYVDGIPSFLCRKIARPKATQEPKELPHINLQRFVKGKTKWGTVSLTLYDFIAPSGMQSIMEWQRLHHEAVTGRDGYADFYKKDVTIDVLGPVGEKVEQWLLKGCQIADFDGGELDWGDDNPVEVLVTLQPDYCILNY
jgi:hypothetical protein